MKAGILLTIGIIFLSITIAFVLISKNFPSQKLMPISSKSTLQASIHTYTNPKYNFTFSFPNTYTLRGNSEKIIIFPSSKGATAKIIIEVVPSRPGFSYIQQVNQTLVTLCRDKNSKTQCLSDSQSVITSREGIVGSSYYLRVASQSGIKNTVIKGPISIFALPLVNESKPALLIFYPEDLNASKEEDSVLRTMIDTLVLPSITLPPVKISSQSSRLTPPSLHAGSASAQ